MVRSENTEAPKAEVGENARSVANSQCELIINVDTFHGKTPPHIP